uniref:Uncharacterized protein n=1 Tax=Amphimedon queenslandica TaxID=400682 RepID=A0A1X7UA45_AMPQE
MMNSSLVQVLLVSALGFIIAVFYVITNYVYDEFQVSSDLNDLLTREQLLMNRREAMKETLTGFKWMGNLSYTFLEKGEEVLFAFEEAIGFMFGTTVLDIVELL